MVMMRTRFFVGTVVVALAAGGGHLLRAQGAAYDILIRGGDIVDGTGNPWFAGDVGIRNGRIAAVGRLGNATASRSVDATGRVGARGCIARHTLVVASL